MPLPKSEDDRVTEFVARRAIATRAQFRPTADQKELYLRAASLEGQTLSEFMRVAVEERAKSVIAEHERVVLNDRAREKFLAALVSPPAPNEKLTALAKKYASEVISRS